MDWQPTAGIGRIRARAALLCKLRQFFAARGILEVETPLLCVSGVTDPAIEPLMVEQGVSLRQPRYLQTSPEYAMKRLLAAYGESVFQIGKAFRDGEVGARHNPEFTLLEWYRPGFGQHQLMDEVADLVRLCLGERPLHKRSYRQLFLDLLEIDPCTASIDQLQAVAREQLDPGSLSGDRDLWLDLLMSHLIEPQLAVLGMCFVYDYPASQAALSCLVPADDVIVGQRFELYVDGMELANGYFELTDAAEQRQRFEQDNLRRREHGLSERPLDERLLAAMSHGLPSCSGVALGVDRLLMLVTGVSDIREVLAFDWERS
ncbi:MAG: EF-P lysine aminoacylase GenX [Gammaproteobacteria bacterium]|nr:MAG: EF-P lysine aminoacylase GenX [Gammaproteobacteria bacterium]RLA58869.1 MAG: EF-P lysine aminoacylase GenX [Gammaproteobacteria bacterium]HDY81861.1 EF-P lysine aminoacylase GenX [Halieaceae bacterium]